jgi:hypothetical protein
MEKQGVKFLEAMIDAKASFPYYFSNGSRTTKIECTMKAGFPYRFIYDEIGFNSAKFRSAAEEYKAQIEETFGKNKTMLRLFYDIFNAKSRESIDMLLDYMEGSEGQGVRLIIDASEAKMISKAMEKAGLKGTYALWKQANRFASDGVIYSHVRKDEPETVSLLEHYLTITK